MAQRLAIAGIKLAAGLLIVGGVVGDVMGGSLPLVAWAEPLTLPVDRAEQADIPEEILRTELILEGRSPLDGSPMTPEAYAKLLQQLQQRQDAPLPVDPELQSLVFQLKLLNLLKTLLPIF